MWWYLEVIRFRGGHMGGVPTMGLVPLWEEKDTRTLSLSTMLRIQQGAGPLQTRKRVLTNHYSACTLILDFIDSGTVKNVYCPSYPVNDILVCQPKVTKTPLLHFFCPSQNIKNHTERSVTGQWGCFLLAWYLISRSLGGQIVRLSVELYKLLERVKVSPLALNIKQIITIISPNRWSFLSAWNSSLS